MTTLRSLSSLTFLLLLALLLAACPPSRGRGSNGTGGGNNDDDDAADDDDTGDDDDSQGSTTYTGSASGEIEALDTTQECVGLAEVTVNTSGDVTSGRVNCGETCVFQFSGPYAFSEDSFVPTADCEFGMIPFDFGEMSGWIWGEEDSYISGSIEAYAEIGAMYLNFDAYAEEGM
jgi:hypothetical protein